MYQFLCPRARRRPDRDREPSVRQSYGKRCSIPLSSAEARPYPRTPETRPSGRRGVSLRQPSTRGKGQTQSPPLVRQTSDQSSHALRPTAGIATAFVSTSIEMPRTWPDRIRGLQEIPRKSKFFTPSRDRRQNLSNGSPWK